MPVDLPTNLKFCNEEADLSLLNAIQFQFFLSIRQSCIEHETGRLIHSNRLIMQPTHRTLTLRRPQLVLDTLFYRSEELRSHLALYYLLVA